MDTDALQLTFVNLRLLFVGIVSSSGLFVLVFYLGSARCVKCSVESGYDEESFGQHHFLSLRVFNYYHFCKPVTCSHLYMYLPNKTISTVVLKCKIVDHVCGLQKLSLPTFILAIGLPKNWVHNYIVYCYISRDTEGMTVDVPIWYTGLPLALILTLVRIKDKPLND